MWYVFAKLLYKQLKINFSSIFLSLRVYRIIHVLIIQHLMGTLTSQFFTVEMRTLSAIDDVHYHSISLWQQLLLFYQYQYF